MVFLVGLALSFWLLDWPWRIIVLVPLAALEIVEWVIFMRLRKVRSITGVEAIAGTRGKAITHCRPAGQVTLNGQIWNARCATGVDAGAEVVVTGAEGIELRVEPARDATPTL